MISFLHLLLIALPAVPAMRWVFWQRRLNRRDAIILCGSCFVLAIALLLLGTSAPTELVTLFWGGTKCLALDGLNRWLLPYTALIYFTILLCMPRAERTAGSSERLLLGLALDLAFFSAVSAPVISLVWILTHLNLAAEISSQPGKARLRLLRILAIYLGTGCLLFTLGLWGLSRQGDSEWPYFCLTLGIVLRKAIVPFHQWLPELFEKGPLGHVIAFCAPQVGAYALIRLLLPTAPQSLLVGLASAALVTAVYGACLAFGRRSFRGTYAGLFMGQTSLVFAGLQSSTHACLTGGLALWLSGGLALTGLGLTVWSLIARRGRLNLDSYQGGYERSPILATAFLLFGLSSCGFPGTLGFLSQDLLLQGTTLEHPQVGVLAAVTTALNGITIMRAYFHLFCGSPASYAVSQSMRSRERLALFLLLALLFGLGLFPVKFLVSRWQAADHILALRHGSQRVHPGETISR